MSMEERERGNETTMTEGRQAEPRSAPPKKVAPKKPRPRRGVAVNDPVGDMLTRLRNAVGARHETVEIPASRLKAEIAKILKAEGYIAAIEPGAASIVLRLKYSGKTPALTGVDRVSRPGRRVYARRDEMPRVLGGLGVAIISTSAGVMSGREARRKGLGGEILATVW